MAVYSVEGKGPQLFGSGRDTWWLHSNMAADTFYFAQSPWKKGRIGSILLQSMTEQNASLLIQLNQESKHENSSASSNETISWV